MNLADQLKEAQGKVDALEGNVKTLTTERDQAAEQVKKILAERDSATEQVSAVSAERDQALAKVQSAEKAHAEATEKLQAAEKERDAVKAQLALSPGHKDLSAGTEDGGSGTVGVEAKGEEGFLKAYNAAEPAEKRRMWKERMKGGFTRFGMFVALACTAAAVLFGSAMLANASNSGRQFDQVILETSSAATGTVATTVSDTLVGTIESITVIVPSGVTCDVAVASSYVTLFSKDNCTGTTTYRPRFTVHNSSGTDLAAGTDTIALTIPSLTNTLTLGSATYNEYGTNGVLSATGTVANAAGSVVIPAQSWSGTLTTKVYEKAVIVDTVTASYDECSATGQTITTLINYFK